MSFNSPSCYRCRPEKGPGETGSACSEHLTGRKPRGSVFREEAERVSPTSQATYFSAFLLGEMILVPVNEMTSYPLRAGPPDFAERTLVRYPMLVYCMPLKLLASSVFFVAVFMTTEPLLGASSTTLDALCASHF